MGTKEDEEHAARFTTGIEPEQLFNRNITLV
jgi:hypothetical protein